ncbi:MAG: UDP-2,4-diacetamido-2,4,6-trideoxy-beta-L-altropyranose hydrolase [Dongiaceae bacterium]
MLSVFRVDASLQIGTGHVMRCLTLADELRRHGASARFICRGEPGNLNALIQSRGYEVAVLASQEEELPGCAALLTGNRPDWIIVDHYALGADWERAARHWTGKLLVIDDLANRNHDCDVLLDQNLYDGVEQRYAALVPRNCRQLIGPRFALLRPEFAEFRRKIARTAQPVSRLLINFGGADSSNETARFVELVRGQLSASVAIDVVVGPANPHAAEIRALAEGQRNIAVHAGTDRMAELMSLADAFVGAGGSTTWERFCLGLPSLVVAVAENQIPTAQYLGKLGAIDYIGPASQLSADAIRTSLSRFLMDHDRRSKMAELGMQLVDGHGAQRVVECLLNISRA